MSQIVPFNGGNLPAYLKGFSTEVTNSDLLSHASNSFPIISIKGKQFTISRDGERTVIPNPKDPEAPANSIDVVLVKANKGTSKVFYTKGYEEGTADKPDCYSNDGVRPDPSVEKPVSKSCTTCPKNVWGSKVTDAGKKVKACSDSVRIAVSTPNAIDDPYFLRVPAASIKHLGELGRVLNKAGADYRAVVTKISFDKESATPLLQFKPVGYLSEEQYKQAVEVSEGDVVQAIMGSNYGLGEDEAPADVPEAPPVAQKRTAAPAPVVEPEEVMEAVEKAAAPAPKTKKSKPAEEPATASLGGFADIDIDSLDFDQ